jgi:imidazoleglycerol phosphate synthase glutamine amidotransferase subunit HisH
VITIIDYRVGNIRSIANMLKKIGSERKDCCSYWINIEVRMNPVTALFREVAKKIVPFKRIF